MRMELCRYIKIRGKITDVLYLISSEAENLALENQNIFFKDYPARCGIPG